MTSDLQQKIEKVFSRNAQADDREILCYLKQLLYETELQNYAGKEVRNIAELAAENIEQLHSETFQTAIIKTGFDDLDARFGGFSLGEFIVVGARPGMGKTLFLTNLALNISTTVPVLYASLDVSEFLLTNRFISAVSEIPITNIIQKKLNDEEKEKLSTIGKEFDKRQLFIHDCCNSSISALKANFEKQIKENGVQVIVVDYLQRISSHRHKYNNRELEISFICRELKNLTKEFNVCVIVSSQLSRSVEMRSASKRPQLSDLRDSGAIEQDADKVLFIYRPEYYGFECFEDEAPARGLADIMVQKNRTGMLGSFRIMRDSYFTNFRNYKDEITFSSNRLNELTEGFLY